MEHTKEIVEAYGERYEGIKDHIDEEGWFKDSILGNSIWVLLGGFHRKFDHTTKTLYWRANALEDLKKD